MTIEQPKVKEKNKIDSEHFFTEKETFEALRTPEGKRAIEYVGSATSEFQAEPLVFDEKGKQLILSDWDLELSKNLAGKKSHILGEQHPEEFPKFHEKKKSYIARSHELGENMFRFSLDFARLCPEEGEFNEDLMADYVKALGLIKARGMEPMVALYHWPMPKYLLETDTNGNITKGGWEHPEAADRFRFYIENVTRFLGDQDKVRAALHEEGFDKKAQDAFLSEGLARHFISINEPINIFFAGYVAGAFPPFKRGRIILAKEILNRLVEAHDIARNELKKLPAKEGEEPKVGVGHNWTYFDGILANTVHKIMNEGPTKAFERTGEASDFLGLQYYFRMSLPLYKGRKDRVYGDHPDFGDVYPKGMYELLVKMNKLYPQKEIFISEFGFSDKDDMRRPYWILETVRYILEARKKNIPIKGMLLWTLVNNFEWNQGMDQKFGLFDKKELEKPLTKEAGRLRSWEAWQKVTKAITHPSEASLGELQAYYDAAKIQYETAIKKTK